MPLYQLSVATFMLSTKQPQILTDIQNPAFSVHISVGLLRGSAHLAAFTQVSVGWVDGSDLLRTLLSQTNWACSAFTVLLEPAG